MDSASEITDIDESSSHDRPHTTSPEIEISKSPRRPRPWSTEGIVLAPSPLFVEPKTSKDDIGLPPNTPVTPKRPDYPPRGLSLQMPPRDISSTSTANLLKRVPLSPKLDPSTSYASSPVSALPRRSRGMDFSRACTNLHHSTLAEQSSPDSSPVVGGRGGIVIPTRKSTYNSANASTVPDSPGMLPSSLWSNGASTEKGGISSSLGSASMMEYISESSSSGDDELMGQDEEEDAIHTTPRLWRSGNGPTNLFGPAIPSSPGADGFNPFAATAAKLMSFQRARTMKRRSRKSSSMTNGHSAFPSSGPGSPPPVLRSIESSMTGDSHRDPLKQEIDSRRKSLSLGTCELEQSDDDQSEGGRSRISPREEPPAPLPATLSDERRSVIRRAVTRRGNLLPKSKPFARIRALLQEESAPVDTEVRREAEVIRQARESDAYGDINPTPSQPTTSASSPSIQPATAGPIDGLEDIPEDIAMDSDISASRRSSSSTFTQHAIRNSGGLGFWNNFDERTRTPPPVFPRESSSGISDDIAMDTPQSSVVSATPQQYLNKIPSRSESRSSTPQLQHNTSDNLRKGNKRMRDDDLDPSFFKRRAVSPGMSLQNSPVLPQSPLQRDGGWWGMQSKYGREVPASQTVGDRISSGGSVSSGNGAPPVPPKRVGLQGMSDTNDGLMNMSIE
ncbi:MAG: hypothetical protein LQ346_001040 [Caloplaca aetnensis]|nr:MAG: hypothetical protein LQ346_001040 [Caloplaca aetnensis]